MKTQQLPINKIKTSNGEMGRVIKAVNIDGIKSDPSQPRSHIDPFAVEEMAESIKTLGLINSIEIDSNFNLVTGNIRLLGAKKAGLKTIPCSIVDFQNSKDRFLHQVAENLQQNSLSDMDVAKALSKIILFAPGAGKTGSGGHNDKGITWTANVIGKSEGFVREKLDLLERSAEFKKAVRENKVSATFARAIKYAPEAYREQVEKKITEGGFTTRDNALMVVDAIKYRPEKADQLLAVDYKDADPQTVMKNIRKIVPDYSETPATDALVKAFEPSEKIAKTAWALKNLLDQYSIVDMGSFNVPRVVMALDALGRVMKNWLEKTPKDQNTEKNLKLIKPNAQH
jgi:ParB family chromosome partitioning protein